MVASRLEVRLYGNLMVLNVASHAQSAGKLACRYEDQSEIVLKSVNCSFSDAR